MNKRETYCGNKIISGEKLKNLLKNCDKNVIFCKGTGDFDLFRGYTMLSLDMTIRDFIKIKEENDLFYDISFWDKEELIKEEQLDERKNYCYTIVKVIDLREQGENIKIRKVNLSQKIVDRSCMEIDYIIEVLEEFVNNKDYLELVKNIEKINVLNSLKTKKVAFLDSDVDKEQVIVTIDFFYKNDKKEHTMFLIFDPLFFEQLKYRPKLKNSLSCNIINRVSDFLEDIQKYQGTEYEEIMTRKYFAYIHP